MNSAPVFTPAQPPRAPGWLSGWHFLYGERLRNSVWGVAEPAFDEPHRRYRFIHMWSHLVSDPEMIGHVLLENRANYVRPALTRKILGPLLGNGLLTAEGEDWRRQRHIVAPSFAPAAVDRMAALMAGAAREQVARWPAGPARLDMAAEATEATMHIIARALFSNDPRLTSPEAAEHIARAVAEGGQPRLSRMLGLERWDPSPSLMRLRASRRICARRSRHSFRSAVRTAVATISSGA